jgi:transcriptional regulator with XRE-family HTH domain
MIRCATIPNVSVHFLIPTFHAAIMKTGEVIARARRAAGLKQQELAEAAGAHVQTLKRLEGGAGAGNSTVRSLEKALDKAGAT